MLKMRSQERRGATTLTKLVCMKGGSKMKLHLIRNAGMEGLKGRADR